MPLFSSLKTSMPHLRASFHSDSPALRHLISMACDHSGVLPFCSLDAAEAGNSATLPFSVMKTTLPLFSSLYSSMPHFFASFQPSSPALRHFSTNAVCQLGVLASCVVTPMPGIGSVDKEP